MIRHILLIIIVLISFNVKAQKYNYWNNLVGWNGITHWSQYITYMPGRMGPNALPVPFMSDARISSRPEAEVSMQYQFSTGDQTVNGFVRYTHPFKNSSVEAEVFMVPLEYYQTDGATRDYRFAREFEGYGYSAGDVYFGLRAQLIKEHKWLPDMTLAGFCKTASGGNLSDARFTDAPAYYFEYALGKTFALSSSWKWRPYLDLGFYSWQTSSDVYRQDDAVMWGLGSAFENRNQRIRISLSGYDGYMNQGDQPTVFRLHLENGLNRRWGQIVRYQYGIRDFPGQYVMLGMLLHLKNF